jgi:hypothetical protein
MLGVPTPFLQKQNFYSKKPTIRTAAAAAAAAAVANTS